MGDALTLVRIGTETDGDPAMVCPHLAQWWPVWLDRLAVEGIPAPAIVQARGSYAGSGGTHEQGTCLDLRIVQWTDAQIVRAVVLAREAGARGTWARGPAWGQPEMSPHVHLGLDCPCWSGADYQTTAVDAGYDGLGTGGRGGRDYHPTPKVRRDWRVGIEHMTREIEAEMTPDQSAQLAQIASQVADMHARQLGLVHASVVSLAGQVSAMSAVVTKGGLGTGLTPEQVAAAAEEGARRVLDQLAART